MRNILILFFLLITFLETYSQVKIENNKKIFICAGYGLSGSFFVRSYSEFAPLERYKTFYRKKFIGSAQNIAVGMNIKKNYQIRFGLNFQHFTRKITTKDTLNNVIINLDHTIHHRDYMWYTAISKSFMKRKSVFSPGIGIYYLRPKQEEVEIFYPGYFSNIERDYNNSGLAEGGLFGELSYEYKFEPKVNIGIKTQFYFTATAGTAESITLFPFIKISL